MTSYGSTPRAFCGIFFVISAVFLGLVSGRPFEPIPHKPSSSYMPTTVSNHDTTHSPSLTSYHSLDSRNVIELWQQIGTRGLGPHCRQESLSKREKLIIGLGAGLGGLSVLLSVLAVAGYRRKWHRAFSSTRPSSDEPKDAPRTTNPDTFRRHHQSMRSVGSPTTTFRISYDSQNPLHYTCPYHPGLPSPMVSYYQPVEVYRSLMHTNKQSTDPPTPISSAPQSPISPVGLMSSDTGVSATNSVPSPASHPAHFRYVPQNYQNFPSPDMLSDSEISPRTILPQTRLFSPQPRRVGLPSNVRQSSSGLGIGIPPPPPRTLQSRPLPLRDYPNNY